MENAAGSARSAAVSPVPQVLPCRRCCRAGPAAPLSPAASFAHRSAAELRSDPRNSTAPHRTAARGALSCGPSRSFGAGRSAVRSTKGCSGADLPRSCFSPCRLRGRYRRTKRNVSRSTPPTIRLNPYGVAPRGHGAATTRGCSRPRPPAAHSRLTSSSAAKPPSQLLSSA